MKDVEHIKRLLNFGYKVKEVREITKAPVAFIYQIKRTSKPQGFGCVVCGGQIWGSKSFCQKHYYRYFIKRK